MALPIVAFLGACLYRTETEQQGKKSSPNTSKERSDISLVDVAAAVANAEEREN
jgi:hypothetical protein